MDALIGHTGFVGGVLAGAGRFGAVFNSATIEGIAGRSFRRIVCCGAPGAKWRANRDPETDRAAIDRLVAALRTVRAERFVLISTVDVYAAPRGLSERDRPSPDGLHPYGRHRLALEAAAEALFADTVIVRLPGLFGPGLRKNLLFDLMRDPAASRVDPRGRLQWYPVARLPADLARIEASGLPLVNLVTEPVATGRIRDRFFPGVGLRADEALPDYDLRTDHAALLGGTGAYHMDGQAVLESLGAWIAAERTR